MVYEAREWNRCAADKRVPLGISSAPCPYRAASTRNGRRQQRPAAVQNAKLRRFVARKSQLEWVLQQIAGWLKLLYSDDETMRVSHETIYRSLFIQARGVLKAELTSTYGRGE